MPFVCLKLVSGSCTGPKASHFLHSSCPISCHRLAILIFSPHWSSFWLANMAGLGLYLVFCTSCLHLESSSPCSSTVFRFALFCFLNLFFKSQLKCHLFIDCPIWSSCPNPSFSPSCQLFPQSYYDNYYCPIFFFFLRILPSTEVPWKAELCLSWPLPQLKSPV